MNYQDTRFETSHVVLVSIDTNTIQVVRIDPF